MRVLFTPHKDLQHLYPLVPLAWACRAAGHEVRIAGPPGLADAIVHTGLAGVVVGRDTPPPAGISEMVPKLVHGQRFPRDWPLHQQSLDAGQRSAIELLGRNSAAAAEQTVDDLIAFARIWRPDL